MTKARIKIPDDAGLRDRLKQEYEDASQLQLCRYALLLANHILESADSSLLEHEMIREGFLINQKWQQGKARVHDVRQASFRIHQLARSCGDAAMCAGLRTAGHAVATAHMREHALVASDYAVKVIWLLHPDCLEAVRNERIWQIRNLQEVKKTVK